MNQPIDKFCQKCGAVFIKTTYQFCPIDGCGLTPYEPTSPEPKASAPVVISWCPRCQVPYNHTNLHENQETHKFECPICKTELKVIYKKDEANDIVINTMPDLLANAAVDILAPIARRRIAGFLKDML